MDDGGRRPPAWFDMPWLRDCRRSPFRKCEKGATKKRAARWRPELREETPMESAI